MPRSLPWTWEKPLHNLSATHYATAVTFGSESLLLTTMLHTVSIPRPNEGCLPARGHRHAHGDDDTKNSGRKMYRN